MKILRLAGPFLLLAALSWGQCAKLVVNPITGMFDCVGSSSSGGGTVSSLVNVQTGTTYTFLDGDRGKLVTGTNASAQAYTLPRPNGSTFIAGWYVDVQNRGPGAMTFTPITSTIDGAASLVLYATQGVRIFSDGTDYYTQKGAVDASSTLNVAGVHASGSGAGGLAVCDSTDTYCLGPKGNNSRTTSLDVLVPTGDPTVANQFRVCTAASGGSCQESWANWTDFSLIRAQTPLTTKGDLLVTDGSTIARLAVGATTGHVLTVDPAATYGIKWAAGGGGSTSIQRFFPAASGSSGNSRYILDNNGSYGSGCSDDATAHSTTGGRCWIFAYDSGTENTTVIAKDQIPAEWVSGAVTATLWFGGNNNNITTQYKAEVACVGSGDEIIPASWTTPQNWASQATTNTVMYSSTITLTMPGSCAADKFMSIRIKRVDGNGYSRIYGLTVKYALP